jgi:GNAT superfamily N-acetyltransferase
MLAQGTSTKRASAGLMELHLYGPEGKDALTENQEAPAASDDPRRPVGYFYTWWRGDPLPPLGSSLDLSIERIENSRLLAQMSEEPEHEIVRRIEQGHHPYLACVGDDPVAYGWSAWKQAEIGELGIRFELPEGNRYLWDFVTLPEWRGHGIYPLMIQEIIRREMGQAERFWIGHDFDNVASAKGIEKAGLPVIGEVWIRDSKPVYVPRDPRDRAKEAARLLQLPMDSGS